MGDGLWNAKCLVLKISDDEIRFFTGKHNYDVAVEEIVKTYHIPLICLTLGREGSIAYYKGSRTPD